MNAGWHGVDLDGTLAHYDTWIDIETVGEPVPTMADRVRKWLADGEEVRILTARVSGPNVARGETERDVERAREVIQDWTEKHFGVRLEVTHQKDFNMLDLWDDRCVQVEKNTGLTIHQQILPELRKIAAAIEEVMSEGISKTRVADWEIANEGFLALERLIRRAKTEE